MAESPSQTDPLLKVARSKKFKSATWEQQRESFAMGAAGSKISRARIGEILKKPPRN